jgi:glutamine amidotransferase PdxT
VAWHAGQAVLVRQDNLLAAAFHPELTTDTRLHQAVLGFEY